MHMRSNDPNDTTRRDYTDLQVSHKPQHWTGKTCRGHLTSSLCKQISVLTAWRSIAWVLHVLYSPYFTCSCVLGSKSAMLKLKDDFCKQRYTPFEKDNDSSKTFT